MSSWEEQKCSPYQVVVPSDSSQGISVSPQATITRPWQMGVVPGGDNYFQIVGNPAPCFPKPWSPNDSHHLEKAALVDLGDFDITILLNRDDNVSPFQSDAALFSFLQVRDPAKLRDALDGFSSTVNSEDALVLATKSQLITLQEIWGNSALRSLDSAIISLYTKASEGAVGYVGSFWVFGTKDPVDAMKLISAIALKADQQMELLEGLRAQVRPLVFQLELEPEDSARLFELAKMSTLTEIAATCQIGETFFLGIGFALQGYGQGAYGT